MWFILLGLAADLIGLCGLITGVGNTLGTADVEPEEGAVAS